MRNIKLFLIISLFYGVTAFGQTSESSKASEAEGECLAADCIEQEQSGKETVSEVQQLASTSCTALINSPACEHVLQEDRKNCSLNPQINLKDYEELDLLEQGQICLVESLSSIPDMVTFVGKDILERISTLIGMEKEEELSISLYLNTEFERTYENTEGAGTKRATLALSQMTSSFFSLLYDAITEEFPCLNERAAVKKACRYAGGTLVGTAAGAGVAIGLAKVGTIGLVIAGVAGGAYIGYSVVDNLISDDPAIKTAGIAGGGGAGYFIAKIAGKTIKITAGAAAGVLGGRFRIV